MLPLVIDNVRRQEDVITESDAPDACYDECNNATLEAERSGKDPALCNRGSTFGTLLYQCTDCVNEAPESANASSDLFPSILADWVAYCANEALSSNESTLSMTTTDMSTTTTPVSRPTVTVSQTAVSGPGADTNSPNTKVIVPAVVVPVVFCLAAATVIWALMRRRRRRMQQNNGDTDVFDGKAQLHADEFRPELEAEAMTTAKEKSTDPDRNSVVAELPARELVGSEMDATSQTDDRRASS